MSSNRLPGHGLLAEGKPFTDGGTRRLEYYEGRNGFAKCSCGVVSPYRLNSDNARKEWHRLHKDEVRRDGAS